MPNSTATNSTWRIDPLVKAENKVVGMIARTKPITVVSCAFSSNPWILAASSVAGSMFIPAPGWTAWATISPTISARVEKVRK